MTMKRTVFLGLALLAVGVLLTSGALTADKEGKKGPGKKGNDKTTAKTENKTEGKSAPKTEDASETATVAPADDPAPVETPESRAIARLSSAYDLAELGRDTKSPEALIAAARILRETKPPEFDDETKPQIVGPGGVERPAPPKSLLDDAEALLAEARALAKSLVEDNKMTPADAGAVETLAKRVDSIPSFRGAQGGPHTFWGQLKPGQTAIYQLRFEKRDFVRVAAQGTTHMQLEVKHSPKADGHVAWGKQPRVEFLGGKDNEYRIRLTNKGPVLTQFRLFTN